MFCFPPYVDIQKTAKIQEQGKKYIPYQTWLLDTTRFRATLGWREVPQATTNHNSFPSPPEAPALPCPRPWGRCSVLQYFRASAAEDAAQKKKREEGVALNSRVSCLADSEQNTRQHWIGMKCQGRTGSLWQSIMCGTFGGQSLNSRTVVRSYSCFTVLV